MTSRSSHGEGAASAAPSAVANLFEAHLFEADCGHRWLGAAGGYHGCPTCGRADADDRHLTLMQRLPVQSEGWLHVDW